MPSNVDVVAHTAPSIMLIEAMTRSSKNDALLEMFGFPKIPLQQHVAEVKLTINGVEVDFVKTAQEMWDRMVHSYEKDVEEAARKLLSKTRFEKLEQIISQAEDEIEREVEALIKEEKYESRLTNT
jgi:predicted lipid-binding transport protein (Tim44 family)